MFTLKDNREVLIKIGWLNGLQLFLNAGYKIGYMGLCKNLGTYFFPVQVDYGIPVLSCGIGDSVPYGPSLIASQSNPGLEGTELGILRGPLNM